MHNCYPPDKDFMSLILNASHGLVHPPLLWGKFSAFILQPQINVTIIQFNPYFSKIVVLTQLKTTKYN